jgi:hypothetical protein
MQFDCDGLKATFVCFSLLSVAPTFFCCCNRTAEKQNEEEEEGFDCWFLRQQSPEAPFPVSFKSSYPIETEIIPRAKPVKHGE